VEPKNETELQKLVKELTELRSEVVGYLASGGNWPTSAATKLSIAFGLMDDAFGTLLEWQLRGYDKDAQASKS
jgi:hypothetical protein